MATKVHQIYAMDPVIVFVPSLTFSTIYIVFLTMTELWKLPLGVREGWVSFFSFLIQLLQQPLVKKIESGTDTLNIYLEEVGSQELKQLYFLQQKK